MAVATAVQGPTVSGKYIHWDKLRFHTPPEGLSHEEWWFGLKLHRRGQSVALRDKTGKPFSFSLVDPLPEFLHEVDFMTGGIIQMPQQVTNQDTRNTYIVSSLIEEAFTSSQLEGAASTREIAKELVRREREPRSRGERMILNNYRTMQRIIDLKDVPLSKSLVFEIHKMVTQDALDDPSGAGRFRRQDEYRVVGDDEGTVFHDPPPSHELEKRMEAMCDFANGTGSEGFIHPALRSMILHFWVGYDHPFLDGNGRTARALFYWSMLKHGYWLFEFVSISHAIIKSPISYGRSFLHSETDNNDLTYFLIYHSAVVRRAIKDLIDYIKDRSNQLQSLEAKLRGIVSLNYRQRELISHALRHPGQLYSVASHQASHNVSRQTSNHDLLDLAKRGLLKKIKGGRMHFFVAVSDLEARLSGAIPSS
jgi:Fic family protein